MNHQGSLSVKLQAFQHSEGWGGMGRKDGQDRLEWQTVPERPGCPVTNCDFTLIIMGNHQQEEAVAAAARKSRLGGRSEPLYTESRWGSPDKSGVESKG